jgi:hypothetical protein
LLGTVFESQYPQSQREVGGSSFKWPKFHMALFAGLSYHRHEDYLVTRASNSNDDATVPRITVDQPARVGIMKPIPKGLILYCIRLAFLSALSACEAS